MSVEMMHAERGMRVDIVRSPHPSRLWRATFSKGEGRETGSAVLPSLSLWGRGTAIAVDEENKEATFAISGDGVPLTAETCRFTAVKRWSYDK
jgi:hypothetical protein